MTDPNATISEQGVSIWLDDLSRDRILSGNLEELIETRSIVGVTTNPTIFNNAISKGSTYADFLHQGNKLEVPVSEAIRFLTSADVRRARLDHDRGGERHPEVAGTHLDLHRTGNHR